MQISMYQASVPVFIQMMMGLAQILEKASDFADKRHIDPSVLVNSRLAVDMFPLVRHVQHVSDISKACVARLAGILPPVMPDNEISLVDLTNRVKRTIEFLQSVRKEQIDGSEEKHIFYQHHGENLSFSGSTYLLHTALPNFFFHLTVSYSILRHVGMDIGKADYMGA